MIIMQFFGPKTVPRATEPKIENFEKIKKRPPGICPIYKCTKFQKISIIFKAYSLPQSFSGLKGSKIGPQGPKMKIKKKKKKNPRYLPNLQVYQISKDFDNF